MAASSSNGESRSIASTSPERGVDHQLPGLDRARVGEERVGRAVVAERGEHRVRVADRGRQAPQLGARGLVRRPVLGLVGPLMARVVAARRRVGAERVDVAEQVVAVLDARAGHDLPVRPRQVHARERLQQLPVVDQRGLQVARHHVGQVQALAALHPGHVGGGAHEVAAVVHVHVQVAAVPAVGGGVEAARRLDLDEGLPGRRDLPLDDAELQAPRAGDGQRRGRDGERDVLGVEERPSAHVPLVQHPVGEPRAAGGVGHRPARAAARPQPQPGGGGRAERCGERDGRAVHGHRHVGAVDVDGRDARPTRGHGERVARDDGGHLAVDRGVDDHVQRHRHPGDHRSGRSAVDLGAAVGDPHDDDARGRCGADHRAHGLRPVAGLRVRREDVAEPGEAGPAEHVDPVVAPVPAAFGLQAAVAGQHRDDGGRQVQHLGLAAAHPRDPTRPRLPSGTRSAGVPSRARWGHAGERTGHAAAT